MGDLIAPEVVPGLRYAARRFLTINGQEFQPGDIVPLDVVPPDKLKRWVETRTIVLDNRNGAKPPIVQPIDGTVGPATIQAEGAGDGSTTSGAGGNKAAGNGAAHDGPIIGTPESHIQHIGRGWYNVTHAGKTEKVRTEAKAADRLAELQGGGGDVAKGEGVLENDPERAGGASPIPGVGDETGPMAADGEVERAAAEPDAHASEFGAGAGAGADDFEPVADAAAVLS